MAQQPTSRIPLAAKRLTAASLKPPRGRSKAVATAPAPDGNGQTFLEERQRREMIATGAFLRAQRRGFESGVELEDWLAAEREIDRWLRGVGRGSEAPPLFEE